MKEGDDRCVSAECHAGILHTSLVFFKHDLFSVLLRGQTLPRARPPLAALNAETMRQHLFQAAERMEEELGDEHPCLMEGGEEDGEQLPIPDGPLTVGLEGGFVRARHQRGCFEVIVGKSRLEFKRDAEGEEKSQKCLGFVQTYD